MQKLMKRRSDGGIQEWSIEVVDNAFRVTSGKQGGKQKVNEWTYCNGKNKGRSNETTDEEQAQVQAKAKWNKKLSGEYSTSLSSVDEIGFHKAMLAKDWNNYGDKVEFPVYAQPKLDGIRCIADKNGLKTRTGKKITAVPHIEESLESFFKKHPEAVLDGELYCDKFDNDFNAICHHVRRSNVTEESLEKAKVIEYHVYDTINKDRFAERSQFISQNCDMDYVVVVETRLVSDNSELDTLYCQWTDAGYEGQMIRVNAPYENKRSKTLLKRKEFIDAEYTILGYKEGIGNRVGTIGHFVFETEKGVSFHSNVKGNREYISDLLVQGDSLIGKSATIKYFNLTPNGVPRFPYVVAIRDYE
jgi:DNA ligase-1|tara:strand:- start:4519 stop:5595 length:1077 start_codon:yes stop_codon:yes gene_type:complete